MGLALRASRIRAKDLEILSFVSLDLILDHFDINTQRTGHRVVADKIGTSVQNVRNWQQHVCKPEGANLSKVIRSVLAPYLSPIPEEDYVPDLYNEDGTINPDSCVIDCLKESPFGDEPR